jgi:hypothetical protein
VRVVTTASIAGSRRNEVKEGGGGASIGFYTQLVGLVVMYVAVAAAVWLLLLLVYNTVVELAAAASTIERHAFQTSLSFSLQKAAAASSRGNISRLGRRGKEREREIDERGAPRGRRRRRIKSVFYAATRTKQCG